MSKNQVLSFFYMIISLALLSLNASTFAQDIAQTPALLLGDVNCDEQMNAVDALAVMQYDVGLRSAGVQPMYRVSSK